MGDTRLPEKQDHESWQTVLAAAGEELERQFAKWGRQEHPDGTGPATHPLMGGAKVRGGFATATQLMEAQRSYNDTLASTGVEPGVTWTDILLEEAFEAFAEPEGSSALYVELIQTAAVALQWAASLVRDSGNGYPGQPADATPPAEAAGGTAPKRPDWVAATAGDPLQPIAMLAMRASMTPDVDAQVDEEAEQFAELIDELRPEDLRRMAFLGCTILSFAPRYHQQAAMQAALDAGLEVVWRTGARHDGTPRGAFGERI